jgi:hypothetical protein
MKIKLFAIVCIGSVLILAMSSILIYTQVRTVQGINLDPLADSLYKENSKILTWILSTVPLDKIDTMKLPESWAEIFVVSNSDLQLVSSTNAAHKGVALYRHPLLLDQAAAIVNAIKNGKTTTVSARKFMIVIQPLGPEQSIVALKPKAWETAIVSRQNDQMKGTSSSILTILGAFLLVGGLIAVAIAFIITSPRQDLKEITCPSRYSS